MSFVGLLVGSAFGVAFVLANAHSPVSGNVSLALRLLGGACFVAVIAAAIRASRPGPRRNNAWYTRGFWWVVAAEAALLLGGLQFLRITNAPTQANVAWVAFVVGLHFVALALVWSETSIAVPGASVLLLGAAGLALSATAAATWVPLVSGVCSGFVLLAGSLWAAAR